MMLRRVAFDPIGARGTPVKRRLNVPGLRLWSFAEDPADSREDEECENETGGENKYEQLGS